MICITAHEIGKIDPLAYEKEEFINPKVTATKQKNGRAAAILNLTTGYFI